MRTYISMIFLLILILGMYSCQKYPKGEIDKLNSTLESAFVEKVHKIYPEEFNSLKDSINIVLVRIESEKSKVAFRKFDQYKNQLIDLNKEVNKLREIENVESETDFKQPDKE